MSTHIFRLILVYFFVIVIVIHALVTGLITESPTNTEAMRIGSTNFSCAVDTTAAEIQWHHRPYGSTRINGVFIDVVFPTYQERFKVFDCDEHHRKCILNVTNILSTDAGTIYCIHQDQTRAAELIVYDQYPSNEQCYINVQGFPHSDIIIGNNDCGLNKDTVEINCTVTFFGNLIPTIAYQDISGNTLGDVSIGMFNNSSSSVVKFVATRSITFICSINYEADAIKSKLKWRSHLTVMNLLNNDSVQFTNCSSPTQTCTVAYQNLRCSPEWMPGGTSVSGDKMMIMRNLSTGKYDCMNKCVIRTRDCTTRQSGIDHHCQTTTTEKSFNEEPQSVGAGTIVGIVVSVILVLVILAGLLLWRFRYLINKNDRIPEEQRSMNTRQQE